MEPSADLDAVEFRRMAERGKSTLEVLGVLYFGFTGVFLFLGIMVSGLAMLGNVFRLTTAALLFAFVYQGYDWARITVGCLAVVGGLVVLLAIALNSPTSIGVRLFMNGLVFLQLGVAAILFFSKSVLAYQLSKRRQRGRA